MNNSNAQFEAKKAALIARLKRVEGQLRGIQSMISSEDDCERVAQQLSAARKALDKAFFEAMRCAMEQELAHGEKQEASQRLNEILSLMSKYG
jgi:DNA-binding FrmR family transcriptional regulator